jgi:hypothetical protein
MNINYNDPHDLNGQFHATCRSLLLLRVEDKRLLQFRSKLHKAIAEKEKRYPKLTNEESAIITNAQYAVDRIVGHALTSRHTIGSNSNEYKWTVMRFVNDYDILSLPHEQFVEKLKQELHQLN